MLPREKFLQRGVDTLSDLDLISILIGSGIKGRDFKRVSKSVLSKFRKVLKDSDSIQIGDLTDIGGVGEVVAMRILAGIELGRRIYYQQRDTHAVIYNSNQAYEVFKDMSNLKKERVDSIYLNSRFEVLRRETVSLGSVNCANLTPRDVIYPAIQCNASFIVLAHNHPSGDCTPSKEDILLTERLIDALDLVGLNLLDHIVVSSNGWGCINVSL